MAVFEKGDFPNLIAPPIWNTIIPADTDLPSVIRGIYVEAAGYVHVTNIDGTEDTISVDAKVIITGLFKRIWNTGTTATTIHSLK